MTGTAKGVRLRGPGRGTRPLSDRVKQALFGALESEGLVGRDSTFLDLFAGSGAGGIEALSRGAAGAVFVERDPAAAAVVDDNLRRAGLAGGRVVRADAVRFLDEQDAAPERPFAAVLVDPPYGDPVLLPVLERLGLADAGWLRHDGVVVAKHFWRDEPPADVGRLRAIRTRRFGETALTFYRLRPAAEVDAATEDG